LICTVVLLCATLLVPRVLAQKPAVDGVLKAAAGYLVTFSEKLQAVTAEEQFLQMDTGGNKINKVLRLNADVVMVGIGDGAIFFFRDVYAIDTKPMHPRSDQLLKLFEAPPAPPVTSLTTADKMTEDGAFWYISRNLRTLDSPFEPLALLRGTNQSGVTFTVESVKKMDGADVAVLKFTETRAPSAMRTPAGLPVSGRFWVEVATGTIRQSEVILSDKSINCRYSVKYALEKTTSLWLPVELSQQVQVSGAGGGVEGIGSTGAFEAHLTYSKFRQVPIDVSKIR
jgi:hypothetical protein